jgi:hypothetical protein
MNIPQAVVHTVYDGVCLASFVVLWHIKTYGPSVTVERKQLYWYTARSMLK